MGFSWGATRRALAVAIAGAVVAAPVCLASGSSGAAPAHRGSVVTTSEDNGYTFLDQMMDKYATGSTLRLVRSFLNGSLSTFTDSETYDDALVIDAFLARGTTDDISRAEVLGNSLLYIQAHDPKKDGRIRVAYGPKPLTGGIVTTDSTSDVGNMAWIGQALVQLYARTHVATYLTGAEQLGTWLVTNTHDTRGPGGYTGGYNANGTKIQWKSTEHNIDLWAMFTMLATETGNSTWTADATWAQNLVYGMWNKSANDFYVGTGTDGKTPNNSEHPEDVNSWSYLAFENPTYAASITWDVTNLSVSVGGFSGTSFCSGAKNGVWFEGTAHLADALLYRNSSGDAAKAAAYIADVAHAQTNGLNNDGLGIIAASINKLSDCDGDLYYASLHIGATAWYLMALQKTNPFHLIP